VTEVNIAPVIAGDLLHSHRIKKELKSGLIRRLGDSSQGIECPGITGLCKAAADVDV
jgi:hypothetical protein